MEILKFKCYDEFHCIGPECTDSCCVGWRIALSKREYLNYKKMDCSPELKEAIHNAFKRRRDKNFTTDEMYADMKLNEDGTCPFLGEDHLCRIQKEMGGEALTLVCQEFPRLCTRVGKVASIVSLDMTCPRVVEILMDHPKGLELKQEKYVKGSNIYIDSNRLTAGIPVDWPGFNYLWDIKTVQLDILQNRNFSIRERLLIIGYYCMKTQEYLDSTPEKIPQLGKLMQDNELCKNIAESLTAHQSDDESSTKTVNIFSKFFRTMNQNPTIHTRDVFFDVAKKIDYAGIETGFTFTIEKYQELVQRFGEIEEKRSYILENVLVNYFFPNSFMPDMWDAYVEMAVFYNQLKLLVPTQLPDEYNDTELATAISKSVKAILNPKLTNVRLIPELKERGTNTLPYLVFLL